MTINIFVIKGDLNGKIVVVRFFFFVGYRLSFESSNNMLDIACPKSRLDQTRSHSLCSIFH